MSIIPFNRHEDADMCETCLCSKECDTMPDHPERTDADMDAWEKRCYEAAERKGGFMHCRGPRSEWGKQ